MTEKSPEVQFMEAHSKALNKSLEDLTVEALKSLFGHVYYYWQTLKPALGEQEALKCYGNVWAALAAISFGNAMKELGLAEVKDLPTLGKIVEHCFTGVPTLYVTKRNTEDEYIGHVLWCANPAYGPADNTYRRHDYYRQEVYLTYVYLWTLIAEAKKKGLQEEILVDIPTGRCRDGSASACQMILRSKNADPHRHLPEIENRFVDLEMGEQEPVLYVLQQQNRTLEEQGPAAFVGFFGVDYLAWLQLHENAEAKATQVYQQLWQTFPPIWTKEAKLELEIGKVTRAEELAAIIAYCQKKRYLAFEPQTVDQSTVVMTATADPYVEVANMFAAPPEYKRALVEMEKDFVNNVIGWVVPGGNAKAEIKSHIANGDEKTEISVTLN